MSEVAMIPPSDIVEFILAWPSAKASIEQNIAIDYDVNSGAPDPVLFEIATWFNVREGHLESIARFEQRLNGMHDLSDFSEDLGDYRTYGDTVQERMVALAIIGVVSKLRAQGRSSRIASLKSDLEAVKTDIDCLIDQRLGNINYQ